MTKKKTKILFVGAEAMPFAATGGLGDVLGSLPSALQSEYGDAADIRVVLPLYSATGEIWKKKMEDVAVFEVPLAWRRQYCGIKRLEKDNVVFYFVDNEYYFKRDRIYGEFDDGERYAYFCRAILEMLPHIGFYPDIIHANDWQAAMSIVYLNRKYRHLKRYAPIKTVFTIHNIEYQGKYDFSILGDVFDLGDEDHSLMEYDGCINLMKAAIEWADMVSTVSPRYAEEIRTPEYSHGLSNILDVYSFKLCGILNGIDYGYYDPEHDPVLKQTYSADDQEGKYVDKKALQSDLGLPENKDIPVLAIISRLASHKGLDLVTEIAYNLIGEDDVQLILLGTGEARFEDFFRGLETAYPDKVRALIRYDRDLSRRIYASADIFIMPSKSEPCGLSQMIASRYGAIPVVRETGGLFDSIKGYWECDGEIKGNGFTFANYSSAELLERTRAAVALWRDSDKRRDLIKKIMDTDFSWSASAKEYIEMYTSLLRRR